MMWLLRTARARPLGVIAAVGLCIYLVILDRNLSPGAFWSLFTLWVLSPPLATLLLGIALPRSTQSFWFCAIAAIPLLFGIVIYVSAMLGPPDAQGGLMFLFTPLWQLLGLPIAWLVASAVGLALQRESDA